MSISYIVDWTVTELFSREKIRFLSKDETDSNMCIDNQKRKRVMENEKSCF